MLIAAALTLAQIAQPGVNQHDPEVEALLRNRDEKRRAEQRQAERASPSPADDRDTLASVVPPEIAARLANCLEQSNVSAAQGLAEADSWAKSGGGAYAAQCRGYALGIEGRWPEAAKAFETGANFSGLDAVTQARLWSQAGNAALITGQTEQALRSLDAALARPLPRTLATGEIYLDRARARVASGDLKGARADLDQAVVLAAADPLAWLLSATLARRMDDLPLARLHIEEAASRARNDAAVALEQGIILALSGDNDAGARAAFSRAKELAAAGSEISMRASDYLEQLGGAPATDTSQGEAAGR
jgi:tetratricopeptide (TPR) repeat protein